MEKPLERHQLIFLNPDLGGLFAAYLSHRAGAKVAIIDELGRWREKGTKYPVPFPASGTFFPQDVDLIATESGFPPPVWESIPNLALRLPDRRIRLKAKDGPGGLLLALVESFRKGKAVLSSWLQDHINKAEEYLEHGEGLHPGRLKRPETSVAVKIRSLDLAESDQALVLFDMLSVLVLGRGIFQLDVSDFHFVLAGFLNGWHAPAPGERAWGEILARRLQRKGARWHEVERISAIQSFSRQSSMVRCSDGTIFAARILVVPENDRFHHPATSPFTNIIRWRTWLGSCAQGASRPPILGLCRPDLSRPPVNDSFVACHLRSDMQGRFSASAPVEDRYFLEDASRKLKSLTSRIKALLTDGFGLQIMTFTDPSSDYQDEPIALPGTASTVTYPEGPLWGDDVLTRLRSADRLAKRVLGRLR